MSQFELMEITQLEIPANDRLRMLKLEKYLGENLEKKFKGIDFLAEKFNVSPTKLKKDFKQVYGRPIYLYYQQLQMKLANQLLKKEDLRIKELAVRMGYESAGKFSRAFKKHNLVLPSQWMKQ
jgi:AraC-like DNA-binding protein